MTSYYIAYDSSTLEIKNWYAYTHVLDQDDDWIHVEILPPLHYECVRVVNDDDEKPKVIRDDEKWDKKFTYEMYVIRNNRNQLLLDSDFSQLDDIKSEMSDEKRAVAAEHGVYRKLFTLDMTDDYGISDRYDAAICVGVFGFGPPHIEHLHHIMGAVKPGAPVVLTVNGAGWNIRDWDDSFAPHLTEHDIELVADTRIRYLTKEDIDGHLIHLRRAF